MLAANSGAERRQSLRGPGASLVQGSGFGNALGRKATPPSAAVMPPVPVGETPPSEPAPVAPPVALSPPEPPPPEPVELPVPVVPPFPVPVSPSSTRPAQPPAKSTATDAHTSTEKRDIRPPGGA